MITSYEFMGTPKDPWHFFPADFGRINLLVGQHTLVPGKPDS